MKMVIGLGLGSLFNLWAGVRAKDSKTPACVVPTFLSLDDLKNWGRASSFNQLTVYSNLVKINLLFLNELISKDEYLFL